jgi:hypothetical protein
VLDFWRYLTAVATDGDYLNDWRTHLEWGQGLAEVIGIVLAAACGC